MITTTFKSVLYSLAYKAGLDPAENLNDNVAESLTDYINARTWQVWQKFAWPELVRIDQRFYRYDWDSGTTYAAGDEVYSPTQEEYYISLQGSNLNNAVTDTDYWEVQDELDPYILLNQTGHTEIGEILHIYSKDPRITNTAIPQDFWLYNDRIQLTIPFTTSVYAEYRIAPSEFTHESYAGATAYVADDLVYYSTTGECYKALQSTTGNLPTDTTYWVKVDFPKFMKWAVVSGSYADWLDEEGQFQKSEIEESKFEDLLQDEYEKIGRQQKQRGPTVLLR